MWTRAQISDSFVDVQRVARQLAWVPEGQGGLITIALAKLAARLKVRGCVSPGALPLCEVPEHLLGQRWFASDGGGHRPLPSQLLLGAW